MPHSRLKYLLSLRMDVYCGNCSRVEDEEGSRRCRCKPPSPWPWSPCTCMVARSMLCHLLFPPSLNVTRTGECLSCAYTWSQSIASPSSPLIHQLLLSTTTTPPRLLSLCSCLPSLILLVYVLFMSCKWSVRLIGCADCGLLIFVA